MGATWIDTGGASLTAPVVVIYDPGLREVCEKAISPARHCAGLRCFWMSAFRPPAWVSSRMGPDPKRRGVKGSAH